MKLDYLTDSEPEKPAKAVTVIEAGPDALVQALKLADEIRQTGPCVIEYREENGLEVGQ